MNRPRWLTKLYALLVDMYPPGFRGLFADEMRAVFEHQLAEADQRGGWAVLHLCLRELRDWPDALLREYLLTKDNPMRHAPIFRAETWLVCAPFILLAIISVLSPWLAQWALGQWPILFIGGATALALLYAGRRGWPRWSATWFSLLLLIVLNGLSGLLAPIQLVVEIIPILLVSGLMLLVFQRNAQAGLLMMLIWTPLTWSFELEFVPAPLSTSLFVTVFLCLALAAAILVNQDSLLGNLWVLIGVMALVGLLLTWASEYLNSFTNYTPSLARVLRQFIPGWVSGTALAVGALGVRHLIAWHPPLRWIGLMVVGVGACLVGNLGIYRLFLPDDLALYQQSIGLIFALALTLGGLIYLVAMLGLGRALWPRLTSIDKLTYSLLVMVLFLTPWIYQLPRIVLTLALPLGWPFGPGLWRLMSWPADVMQTGLYIGGLGWLALSLWVVARASSALPNQTATVEA